MNFAAELPGISCTVAPNSLVFSCSLEAYGILLGFPSGLFLLLPEIDLLFLFYFLSSCQLKPTVYYLCFPTSTYE